MPRVSQQRKNSEKAPRRRAPRSVQPITTLRPDPKNARKISPESMAGLRASVDEFGDLSGITWNERMGALIAGHRRMDALRAGGVDVWERLSETTGVIVHPKTGERFPVRIVSWDATKHQLAQIAANNPHIQGEFTAEVIEQLRALEEDARFEELRLNALAKQLEAELKAEIEDEPKDGLTDPDEPTAPPAKPIAKLGDLWILGEHRLLCGSSTNPKDVAQLMDGAKAVLMATDPPYGVDYTAVKAGIPYSGLSDGQERWGDIANDDLKDDQLEAFLSEMFGATLAHGKEGLAVYVWHPAGELNHVFRTAMVKAGLLVHRQVIWAKPGFVLTRSGMYHWAHETCFYGWVKGNEPPWYGPKNQTSVWHEGRDDGKAVHPTQKPVALFEIPMKNHTREGDVCLEPFSGSGSQIIAGERLGRRVFAMELEPRWVDAAVARWEAFTGKKAKRG